ncbi:unnamed protein product [Protopolystoma xenopodis]|uniref:Uncharacterized protein n=1 Tax=Protopolystoma xenopodis TaxID=117903 RepID=A0A3S5C496_9PLAT|nr:unnamed protein product [Protopolystoma xenopodis]
MPAKHLGKYYVHGSTLEMIMQTMDSGLVVTTESSLLTRGKIQQVGLEVTPADFNFEPTRSVLPGIAACLAPRNVPRDSISDTLLPSLMGDSLTMGTGQIQFERATRASTRRKSVQRPIVEDEEGVEGEEDEEQLDENEGDSDYKPARASRSHSRAQRRRGCLSSVKRQHGVLCQPNCVSAEKRICRRQASRANLRQSTVAMVSGNHTALREVRHHRGGRRRRRRQSDTRQSSSVQRLAATVEELEQTTGNSIGEVLRESLRAASALDWSSVDLAEFPGDLGCI